MSPEQLPEMDLDYLIAQRLFPVATIGPGGDISASDPARDIYISDYSPHIYEAQAYDLAVMYRMDIRVLFEGSAGSYTKIHEVEMRRGLLTYKYRDKRLNRAIAVVAGMYLQHEEAGDALGN